VRKRNMTNTLLQPDRPPPCSVGDLLNAIVPALETNGWSIDGVTDDGCMARACGKEIRIWLDYETDLVPTIAPSRDRLTPSAFRDFGRAVQSYDIRRGDECGG
jgi:hypothetical protein